MERVDRTLESLIIEAVLEDETFYRDCQNLLSPENFRGNNSFIVELVSQHYAKYKIIPSKQVLTDLITKSDWRDKGGCISIIRNGKCSDSNYVRDRLLNWSRWTIIEDIWRTYQDNDPQELARLIQEASRIGRDINETDFCSEIKVEKEARHIPTPWKWLNSKIVGGGPAIGDLCVIMTLINGGKTTALVNVAYECLLQGLAVIYVTFEDGNEKIKRRLTQRIMGITSDEVLSYDPIYLANVRERFIKKTKGQCDIVEGISARTTVEEIAALTERLEDRKERKIDIVITDYSDRFKARGRTEGLRHALRQIFEDGKWFAKEFGVIHWTGKQSRKLTGTNKRFISMEDSGEAFGAMESPDLVIGIGQDEEDKSFNRALLHAAKVRDGEAGGTCLVQADFTKQKIMD